MSDTFESTIVRAAADVGRRVAASFADPATFSATALALGWQLDAVPAPLAALADASALETAIAAVTTTPDSPSAWLALAQAVSDLATRIRGATSQSFGAALDGLQFGATFVADLIAVAAFDVLRDNYPRVASALVLLGIVRRTYVAPTGRPGYVRTVFVRPDVGAMLTNPATLLELAWAWGDPALDGSGLLDALLGILRSLGIPSGYMAATPSAELVPRWTVGARPISGENDIGAYALTIEFAPVEPDASGIPGLAITPRVMGQLAATIEIAEHTSLQLAAAIGAGATLVLRPDADLRITSDDGSPLASASASIALVTTFEAPRRIIGLAGPALIADGWQVRAGLLASTSGPPDVFVEAGLTAGRFTLGGSSALLGPAATAEAGGPGALAIGWSHVRGIYVVGGALETTIPIGRVIGPVAVDALEIRLRPHGSGIALEAGLDVRATLGPLAVSAAGVGARLALEFPGTGGNLGPVDASWSAMWPDSIGLAIDAPLVHGAGMIDLADAAQHHYTGALTVTVSSFGLTAIGSLHDPPDGPTDAALIASALFPGGVAIGMGAFLDGAGAIVAIGRRFDTDALRAGLAHGAAASLLSPPTIATFPAALAAIDRYLPAAPGRYIAGLMARIGWGTPRVATADVMVAVELPAPLRVVLLGDLQLGLPDLDHRIVDIRIDALGVIDFDRDTLAIDASLHDSKLAGYALTGDMALRLGWGDDPQFLFSIGGFHPQFTPPPGFPTLRRLALTSGDNPQLRMSCYLALTSNTAQVGAQVDLTASGGGFDIAAHVGFDALFDFEPFHFEVEIAATASIAWHGHHLAGVGLDFLLTGPHPWHAKGDATFSILWWDVSVGFDVTWGDAAPAVLPPPPDIASVLRTALGSAAAWVDELPTGEPAWVAFVASSDGVTTVHPFAALVVRERAAPLDYDITQFGTVPLATSQRFTIADVVEVGTTHTTITYVSDSFAPGQFTQLSTDDRLTAPSFETFHAGVRIAANEIRIGALQRASMDSITVVDDPLAPPVRVMPLFTLPATFLAAVTQPATRPSGPILRDLAFSLSSTADLTVTPEAAAIARGATTYAGLREAMRGTSGLQIVPTVQTTR